MRKLLFIILLFILIEEVKGQYSLSGPGYSQNFDSLGAITIANVTGGNLNSVSSSLAGWFFSETGSGANTMITAGTGSSSAGDTYNFGIASGTNRRLGGLQSASVLPFFGFYFINNTGSTITSLTVTYTGETWRVAAANRSDRLDFQYSTNASSLNTGNWTDVDALDYANPGQATGSGSIQHSAVISYTLAGLSISNGNRFFIRWTDFNASGSDDGMGIDDFSFTASLSASSSENDYFRSAITGDWNNTATWQSSPDNINWMVSTLVPNENANAIIIRNGDTVTISSAASADQLIIENAGILINSGGIFTIHDGAGDDIIIQDGGVLTLATTAGPSFGAGTPTVSINGGGILRISRTGYTGNGTGVNSSAYIYQDGSILEYTLSSSFAASGATYFPNVNASTIPVFRTTANITGAGGANPTVINGIFEPIGNISFQGAGIKTFRNGIKGSGNITQDATSGQFVINGSSGKLGGTGILTLNNPGIRITSGSATLMNNKTINGGTLLIDGSLESATNTLSQFTGTTSILINGRVGVEHPGGLSDMFVNAGGFSLGPVSTVEYKSSAGIQTINGRPDYFNVVISGTSTKVMSGNSIINGSLSLTNSIVTTSPGNLITLTPTASIVGGSTASYIDGPLVRQTNNTTVYSFPAGKTGIYKPIEIIAASSDPSTFIVEYFNNGSNTTSPACNPARLQAYVNNEFWDIQRTGGSANAQVRLNYDRSASIGHWTNGSSTAPDPDASKAITVAHYTGSCWQDENSGMGILPGAAISGQVTSKILSNFSPITFGYGSLVTLPVGFTNIKAIQQGDAVKIEWSNTSELEVLYYTIGHSADGQNFYSIGSVHPISNDGSRVDYSFIDTHPVQGINYYQVRSFGTGGTLKNSIIVKLEMRGGATVLSIYPSPTRDGQLTYQANDLAKGWYSISVFNSIGQQVYVKCLDHPGGSVSGIIILPVLKFGIYSLQLNGTRDKFVKTFIVQ